MAKAPYIHLPQLRYKPVAVKKAKKIHESKRQNYRGAEPIHVYKMISPETIKSFQKNSSLYFTKY